MLNLCVATDENGLIGNNNALPWHLPADLKHFRKITMGKPIIMGRKTYESIGHALPGRLNIVLTNNINFSLDNCTVMHTIKEILSFSKDYDESVVIGGAKLYESFLPQIQRMYITRIHAEFIGDTYFPNYDSTEWREIQKQTYLADQKNSYNYSFSILERI
ncbi:dihydrofolate reductase [Candidatus Marithrix sp. Canyon 246]|uniref:dihydrofolate reductase n=1 Tax=Candidatus Marithrix sp. Canyon 246 TaxID=1827136 RepID=UPI000AB6E8EA|nr:dihydrofolate reductase [Candidatus Marithrix sp. Canyon 246]